MHITDWLRAASADAARRGLAQLEPLLAALALSTARLREADDAHRRDRRADVQP
jgi:hypothetical protein